MGKDIEKKSYNGYSFTDGVKFESAYNGDYTAPTEPTEPVEVPFGEMYFGQTEGVRPTISYKAPTVGGGQEPGPVPPVISKTYVAMTIDEGCSMIAPGENYYSPGFPMMVRVSFKEGYKLKTMLYTAGGTNTDVTDTYNEKGMFRFIVPPIVEGQGIVKITVYSEKV